MIATAADEPANLVGSIPEALPATIGDSAAIAALLSGIRRRYGYDFSHYSRTSLLRRLAKSRQQIGVDDYTTMLARVLDDAAAFDVFLGNMSVTVTNLFRDPPFYRAVREIIVPILRTFPYIKVWHAGCATGEEVYSMALLLHEEGLLERARIYATDFNKHSLDIAASGVYPMARMLEYAENYREAGGTQRFADYYSDGYELATFRTFLKDRITFSYHNLVSDGVFGEMNLVCCRNVLIYFDRTLQNQVLTTITKSLRHGGFLCLGNRESLRQTSATSVFEPLEARQRIYRKTHGAE